MGHMNGGHALPHPNPTWTPELSLLTHPHGLSSIRFHRRETAVGNTAPGRRENTVRDEETLTHLLRM